jgi:hypothetical protein
VQIPDDAMWSVLAFIGAIVGWFVRLERRLNERLTRMEYTELQKNANDELNEKVDHLTQLIERQNEQSQLHRSLVGDSLASIRTQVAVIRDRMGDDPLRDGTAGYRRREGGA